MDAKPPNPPRPYWIPEEVDLAALPKEVRLAVSEILNRAYQELVLGAADALERSAGTTYVHLLWLELLSQFELGNQIANLQTPDQGLAAPANLIAQHLRLVGAKQHAGSFLLRLKALRGKHAAGFQRSTSFPR